MAQTPKVSYKRAPSKKLLKLLKPEGDFSWLVELGKEKVAGYQHDVHFGREGTVKGNCVFVYRDGARLIKAKWLTTNKEVDISAHKEYMCQPCGKGFFKRHKAANTESNEFRETLNRYLSDVCLASSQKDKEGAIQTKWSGVERWPWTPFDREARLSYKSMEFKKEARIFDEVDVALKELMSIYDAHDHKKGQARWALPTKGGNQVDQLAVDKEGRLVLLELKDAKAKDAKSVYYSPFQLLQYVWEWQNVLYRVQDDLQKIIDARQSVRLMPKNVPNLTGGIRAAVGFGYDPPRGRNERERKYKYKKVLKIVNTHLPPGVKPIETWAWKDCRPCKLDW